MGDLGALAWGTPASLAAWSNVKPALSLPYYYYYYGTYYVCTYYYNYFYLYCCCCCCCC